MARAAKRAKTNEAAKPKEAAKSPKDAHFERLHAKITELGALGQMLVVGVRGEYNEDEDEYDEVDEDNLTAAQMSQMRHIIITKQREKQLKAAERRVLGDQAGDDFLSFNTSFSYEILPEIEKMAGKKTNDATKRFDELFAFTYYINEHDTWVHDNEDAEWVVRATAKLGRAWKDLLKKSDAELGADAEYTRPGVLALCADLEEKLKMVGEDDVPSWGL